MQKTGRFFCFVLALFAFVASGAIHTASAADKTIIRFSAGIGSLTDPSNVAIRQFKTDVEAAAPGRLEVQIFYGNQLGTLQDVADQVKDGTIQMNAVSFGFLAKYFPDVQAVLLPFLFTDADEAHAAYDGPIGQDLKDKLAAKSGIRILGIGEFGFKNIFNSKRPVTSMQDLGGLKVRVVPTPISLATFKALGAVPVSMDYAETYTGIQRGVLDGAELAYGTIYDAKFYEVAKYVSDTHHFFEGYCFSINDKFLRGLPEDLQKIVRDAAIKLQNLDRQLVAKQDQDAKAQLAGKGMTLTTLSPAVRAQMREAVRPVYELAKTKFGFGPDGVHWIDELTKPH